MLREFWKWIGGDRARFMPEAASSFAPDNDRLMMFLLTVSIVFITGIGLALIVFIIKYRHRPGNEIARQVKTSYALEVAWSTIPFAIVFIAFFWGTHSYLEMLTPRARAQSIFVIAQQWMWKFEHENGVAEINELHVPIGRDINLVMISDDVVHSLFIPDFRVKYDVLPGRYTRAWFRAEKPGRFMLLCTQYCGTDHSRMVGVVEAMSEQDHENWLRGARYKVPISERPEIRGQRLFAAKGCHSCHETGHDTGDEIGGHAVQKGIGPMLFGRFRRGEENHIRESILRPSAKVTAGFRDVMPTYAGLLKENEILDLIAYLMTSASVATSHHDAGASPRKEVAND